MLFRSHPLWCGPLGYQGSKAAMELVARADVVVALGSRMGPFGTLPQHGLDYWPKDAKIIQVEADHTNLGLVKKISVGICGDAKAAAKALTARLAGRTLACDATKAERAAQIKAEKDAWEKELDAWTHEKDPFSLDMIEENGKEKPFSGGEYLHPRQVLRELEKAMPPRAMVSTDIGNINSVANSYLRFEEPRSFFAPMSFGNCGYALPTIIGAKAAAMDRPATGTCAGPSGSSGHPRPGCWWWTTSRPPAPRCPRWPPRSRPFRRPQAIHRTFTRWQSRARTSASALRTMRGARAPQGGGDRGQMGRAHV